MSERSSCRDIEMSMCQGIVELELFWGKRKLFNSTSRD